MKILQIINSLGTGGAEKLLLETIPLYRKKGVEMDILVLNGTDYPFMKELRVQDNCTIYSLGFKSVYNPVHIFKIIPYLKKYDIVHVHLFPAQYWVVIAKLISFSKTKLFFTEHSTSNRRLRHYFLKHINRFFYINYNKIICITDDVFEILKKHTLLQSAQFSVIENGVNLEKFKVANSIARDCFFEQTNEDYRLLIQVSSFHAPKDQSVLIRSLQYLPSTVKLLLVGDGVLRKECEDLVQELKLIDRVLFLGIRNDIPQLLRTVDIIVLSSKYEGLSLSSIEGMASGRPFIASNVPGLSDVVGGAGILFEAGNAQELAVRIKELLDDKTLYEETVKACQVRASQYDIHKMIDEHIALYESIC